MLAVTATISLSLVANLYTDHYFTISLSFTVSITSLKCEVSFFFLAGALAHNVSSVHTIWQVLS